MTQRYTQYFSTKKTHQSQAIPGKNQVPNSAGGYSFQIDDWTRLDRFLIQGSEGGTYYITEQKLTVDNAEAVLRCIKEDGVRVVNRLVEISDEGRAHKNDQALFVLAMCSSPGFADEETRKAAYANLNKVARIGTHLFQFMEMRKAFAGEGRGLRRAVADWYLEKPADQLAYQIIKYPSRVVEEGKKSSSWSHRDVLRVSHPHTDDVAKNSVLKYAVTGERDASNPGIINAIHEIRNRMGERDVADMAVTRIREFNIPREALPTELLTEKKVWEALLEKMPMGAMIRNLGNMSKREVLVPMNDSTKKVIAQLGNEEALKKARIHPITILAALLTYNQGHGMRGSSSWNVDGQLVDALDATFYKSFKFVEPTGKKHLLGVDVSGSMWGGYVSGIQGLNPAIGAAAMALVTANVEENYHIMGFSHKFVDLKISPSMRLDAVEMQMKRVSFGATDCALPMIYAAERGIEVDAFVVYTDNETWYGTMHPVQALDAYRQKTGIPAKLIVCAMVANDFSIADPDDGGMLDVVGFDTATPNIISDFVRN